MSIPFIVEVAAGAVDVLTAQDVSETPADRLCKRFPKQHPLLVIEHIDYASMLIQASKNKTKMLRAGAISREEAINALTKSFDGFPLTAIEKALDFTMSYAKP
jgi:hypothetical protein